MKTKLVRPDRAQASAFEGVPQRSLRMALCLNGTVPVRELAHADAAGEWLTAFLAEHYPESIPGCSGPITIVLVL